MSAWSYEDDNFGPVYQIEQAKDFEEPVLLPSVHRYGSGVVIFTRNGHAARELASPIVGMVEIKVATPLPASYHSFGGWKRSSFGYSDQYGLEGPRLWTKPNQVALRWPDGGGDKSKVYGIFTVAVDHGFFVTPSLADPNLDYRS
ncbi:aldehyde dehydrogenase family protein [Qipengyuania sp.]|uniref:aldehyde dehydrogenase family protein n=1 Tax=Qipengyuania sp. TaxID=2004515 RepID=UPI0035C7FB29